MFAVSAAVRAALRSDLQRPCARIIALASDRVTVRATFEATKAVQLSGSVVYDRSREVRRTASVSLANPTGSLSPQQPGDLFFSGECFRVEQGLILGGVRFYVPLATLVVATYLADMNSQLALTGNDPLFLCQQEFGDVLNLAATTTGEAAILAILTPVLGDGSAWSLNAGGQTLGTPRSFAETDDRLAMAVAVAQDLGCELFSDRYGNPVLQPVPDPTTLSAVRNLAVGRGVSVMTAHQRGGSALPYNRQITYGDNPAYPAIRGEANVTDPTSPIYAGTIGRRTAPSYRSAALVRQDQANTVALNLLISQAYHQDGIATSAVPDPTLDEGDVLNCIEAVSGTNAPYWLQQVTHPIVAGAMSFAGPKVFSLQASS